MVHCFLTGVQLEMDKAFVLNRREARDLLAALSDRLTSLRRLIDQFAPLDEGEEPDHGWKGQRRNAATRKRHRFVCKAVADAMAPGFPEIKLFQTWLAYQTNVLAAVRQGMHAHPVHGAAIKDLDEKTVREGERLGRAVLRLLDPQGRLPRHTQLAICAAACLQLRGQLPEQAAGLIRSAVVSPDVSPSLALSARDRSAIRTVLTANMATSPSAQVTSAPGATS